MNILHLKYATEIEKTGSLNKAAENLYMGQPNLSRAIKELEATLGITIFERSAKGMVPTPEGVEFLGYAEKILKQIDEVESIYRSGKQPKNRFSISVPRASYISEAFTEFTKQLDKNIPTEIYYKETNALRAIKNILASDYKLGIVRYNCEYDRNFKELIEEKGLEGELVAEFTSRLLVGRDSPLADKELIEPEELTGYIEIAHGDPYVPSIPSETLRREESISESDRKIYIFDRASRFELIARNPETYMWVCPVTKAQLEKYGLVERFCSGRKRIFRDMVIHRRDYRMSELDELFINELCAAKRRIIG